MQFQTLQVLWHHSRVITVGIDTCVDVDLVDFYNVISLAGLFEGLDFRGKSKQRSHFRPGYSARLMFCFIFLLEPTAVDRS